MEFCFGKQDIASQAQGQAHCYLLTNGLGGFSSLTLTGCAARNDHAALMAAVRAPNVRCNVIHRLEERLTVGTREVCLSSQQLADGPDEEGWQYLNLVTVNGLPTWEFQAEGVVVEKALALEGNALALRYTVENRADRAASLAVTPWLQFAPKGKPLDPALRLTLEADHVAAGEYRLYWRTNGTVTGFPQRPQTYRYPYDSCDGRRPTGTALANHRVSLAVPAQRTAVLHITWSLDAAAEEAEDLLRRAAGRFRALEADCRCRDPLARQLSVSADAFIVRRDSTRSKTIVAGYPFFEDWGRDTMIALPGLTLSTGRFDDARQILRTFMAYESRGLMPNLFPEGKSEPAYNTADAALLFINCVYLYYRYTGDTDFLAEAYPVMERIVDWYRRGTDYGIHVDEDGLLCAGEGQWQVTWMDVRIDGFLPTPRHGKPVELNAYWYNALKILEDAARLLKQPAGDYGRWADQARASFREKFYHPDGYLRDVISGGAADDQIRCNQIWALTMPFTMVEPDMAARVVDTVFRHLYTPVGLRTLSPEDPQFCPAYGGPQRQRDLAYHQGTVWPFPLGAYYLAYLRVHGGSAEARLRVRRQLRALGPALREGCVGFLPEIYDGANPTASRGCFAQAWSVGELLRVLEALEHNPEL